MCIKLPTFIKNNFLFLLSLLLFATPLIIGHSRITFLFSFVGLVLIILGYFKQETNLYFLEFLTLFYISVSIKVMAGSSFTSNQVFDVLFLLLSILPLSLIVSQIFNYAWKNKIKIYQLIIHFLVLIFIVIHIFAIIYQNSFTGNYLIYNDVLHTQNYTCADKPEFCVEQLKVPLSAVGDFYYYSGIVLTTVGFGDYIPYGGWIRSFTILEGIIGIFILVVMFAKAFDILMKSVISLNS